MRMESEGKGMSNKEYLKLALTILIAAALGALLADYQFMKWQERKEADRQAMAEYVQSIQQPIVYQREEEFGDREVIYEDLIVFAELTEADRDDLIAKLVEAEAGIEPFIGKVAVATTVLNRMELRGMTAEQVIYEKNQYAYPASHASEESVRAVQFAKENRDIFPKNMTLFRTQHFHELKYSEKYIQIGRHYFPLDMTLGVD